MKRLKASNSRRYEKKPAEISASFFKKQGGSLGMVGLPPNDV